MKVIYNTLCRLDQVQQDSMLVTQVALLLNIAPQSFNIINQYGAVGPYALAVASVYGLVPLHPAPPLQIASCASQELQTHTLWTNKQNNEQQEQTNHSPLLNIAGWTSQEPQTPTLPSLEIASWTSQESQTPILIREMVINKRKEKIQD